jgi:cell wall-associated NlpC family hydrolase
MSRIRILFITLLLAFAQAPAASALSQPRELPRKAAAGVRVARFARHFVGVRYRWGGQSPRTGFDCSGLVYYVYRHFGVTLPRATYGQFTRGRRVPERRLRPGDLVFFAGESHVGLYIGHGRFIHAPHTGTRVRVDRLRGYSSFAGARRIRL